MFLDEDPIQKLESEECQREAQDAYLVLVSDRKIRIGGRCWTDKSLKKCGVKEQPLEPRPKYVFRPTPSLPSPPDKGTVWELRVGRTSSVSKMRIVEVEKGAGQQEWYCLVGWMMEASYL